VYAPSGLVGLVLRHRVLLQRRGAGAVFAAYALALIPLAVLLAGAIVLIEMSYRLATQPELGTRMRLLWMPLDAAMATPWLGAALAIVAGGFLLRLAGRRVAIAWDRTMSSST
jgi:branched-chain amino acid transport system permease protein